MEPSTQGHSLQGARLPRHESMTAHALSHAENVNSSTVDPKARTPASQPKEGLYQAS